MANPSILTSFSLYCPALASLKLSILFELPNSWLFFMNLGQTYPISFMHSKLPGVVCLPCCHSVVMDYDSVIWAYFRWNNLSLFWASGLEINALLDCFELYKAKRPPEAFEMKDHGNFETLRKLEVLKQLRLCFYFWSFQKTLPLYVLRLESSATWNLLLVQKNN